MAPKQHNARKTKTRCVSDRSEPKRNNYCVRFNDKKGLGTKFYKSGNPCPLEKLLFNLLFKRYEQIIRGQSDRDVLRKKRFRPFISVWEKLPSLTELPAGFEGQVPEDRSTMLRKLVEKQLPEARRICQECNVQVNESSVADPGSQGIVNTGHLLDDSSLQNAVPRILLRDGSPGGSPCHPIHLGGLAKNQLDNPEGRPPPSSEPHSDEIEFSLKDLERRTSMFPELAPLFQCLKHNFIVILNTLEGLEKREMNEALASAPTTGQQRTELHQIHPSLKEDIPVEDMPNQLSMPWMENVGYEARYPQPYALRQYGLVDGEPAAWGSGQDDVAEIPLQVPADMGGGLQCQCTPTGERTGLYPSCPEGSYERGVCVPRLLEGLENDGPAAWDTGQDVVAETPQQVPTDMGGGLQYQSTPTGEWEPQRIGFQPSYLEGSYERGGGGSFMAVPNPEWRSSSQVFAATNTKSPELSTDELDSWIVEPE